MSERQCRWGILGSAAIARKVWKAICISENSTLTAVGSRSEQRAQSFINECSSECPPTASVSPLGSYEAVIKSPEVDAVYIPLPTGLRKDYILAAAESGKHVLCEKPASVHADDLAEMVEACEGANVQFMDGVMFDHSDRWTALKKHLQDHSPVGKIRRITTHFSFSGDGSFQASNIRTDAKLEPHGCLGDLGWYCIRFTLGITGGQLPKRVSARTITPLQGVDSKSQVPGEMEGSFDFADGLTAAFYCSFLTANQQTAFVSGDEGYVSFDDFVLPFYQGQTSYQEHAHELQIDNCRWNFRRKTTQTSFDEYPCGEAGSQEVRMIDRFSKIVISGAVDSNFPSLSLNTQKIIDACHRSDAAGGQPIDL